MSTWISAISLACLIWCCFIFVVQGIGIFQLFKYYSSRLKPATSSTLPLDQVPHITILRPVKGLEPQLYECLAATFRQKYPEEKLTIYFCVATAKDPAYAVLQRLLTEFPQFDAKIFVEEDDPNLSGNGGQITNLGPNPKIRNMSRGYREAKGDLIWILDSNVWVGTGVAGRMVDKLCGYKEDGKRATPYKFVHQLPLVVNGVAASLQEEARGLLSGDKNEQVSSTNSSSYTISSPPQNETYFQSIWRTGGGRLEEMFMASSHAKFYIAINTVSIAPCIVGKSNMFRRSHLNSLTASSAYSPGIDFFSEYICEDHLIGDLLWRKKVPGQENGYKYRNHGLVFGDLAVQPMAGMSVQEYIGRRIRWLRVRKWTVILATLVEPGIEPFLCCTYASFGLTTHPVFGRLGIPQDWLAFSLVWIILVCLAMVIDSYVYLRLHSFLSIDLKYSPSFTKHTGVSFTAIFAAWIGREFLALPIWIWACWGGTTIMWRGKKFKVGMNMKAVELPYQKKGSTPETERMNNKLE